MSSVSSGLYEEILKPNKSLNSIVQIVRSVKDRLKFIK